MFPLFMLPPEGGNPAPVDAVAGQSHLAVLLGWRLFVPVAAAVRHASILCASMPRSLPGTRNAHERTSRMYPRLVR